LLRRRKRPTPYPHRTGSFTITAREISAEDAREAEKQSREFDGNLAFVVAPGRIRPVAEDASE
jgi:hypothetical protein